MMIIILYYIVAVNIATFLLYGIDKYKAKNTNGAYRDYTADDGCHRWQYRRLDMHATLASQDDV